MTSSPSTRAASASARGALLSDRRRRSSTFLSALPPFPAAREQEAAWERTYARFDARCAERNAAASCDHDTTADVARDMNLLREAVGDPVLNYVGLSYGSGLGATYANLFPATDRPHDPGREPEPGRLDQPRTAT